MGVAPISLWTADGDECVLLRVEGRYELHIRRNGSTIRLETCRDEAAARRRAGELRTAAGSEAPFKIGCEA